MYYLVYFALIALFSCNGTVNAYNGFDTNRLSKDSSWNWNSRFNGPYHEIPSYIPGGSGPLNKARSVGVGDIRTTYTLKCSTYTADLADCILVTDLTTDMIPTVGSTVEITLIDSSKQTILGTHVGTAFINQAYAIVPLVHQYALQPSTPDNGNPFVAKKACCHDTDYLTNSHEMNVKCGNINTFWEDIEGNGNCFLPGINIFCANYAGINKVTQVFISSIPSNTAFGNAFKVGKPVYHVDMTVSFPSLGVKVSVHSSGLQASSCKKGVCLTLSRSAGTLNLPTNVLGVWRGNKGSFTDEVYYGIENHGTYGAVNPIQYIGHIDHDFIGVGPYIMKEPSLFCDPGVEWEVFDYPSVNLDLAYISNALERKAQHVIQVHKLNSSSETYSTCYTGTREPAGLNDQGWERGQSICDPNIPAVVSGKVYKPEADLQVLDLSVLRYRIDLSFEMNVRVNISEKVVNVTEIQCSVHGVYDTLGGIELVFKASTTQVGRLPNVIGGTINFDVSTIAFPSLLTTSARVISLHADKFDIQFEHLTLECENKGVVPPEDIDTGTIAGGGVQAFSFFYGLKNLTDVLKLVIFIVIVVVILIVFIRLLVFIITRCRNQSVSKVVVDISSQSPNSNSYNNSKRIVEDDHSLVKSRRRAV